jgi:multisubunit Na+/H+ antiporter MnhC subunit
MTDKDASPSLVRSIITAAVIGFAVVSFWRGVWYLWDVFVFPNPEDKLYSALASMLTGIVILAVMRTFYSVLAPPIERVNIRAHSETKRSGVDAD